MACREHCRRQRKAECTNPRRNEGRSVHGRAVRTGGVVSQGVCAQQAATSAQTPPGTRSPVRTADGDGKPSVHTPAGTRAAVYTVGPCALEGLFRGGFAHRGRRPVYKPPSKHGPQCAQPNAHTFAAKIDPSPICEPVRNGEKPVRKLCTSCHTNLKNLLFSVPRWVS